MSVAAAPLPPAAVGVSASAAPALCSVRSSARVPDPAAAPAVAVGAAAPAAARVPADAAVVAAAGAERCAQSPKKAAMTSEDQDEEEMTPLDWVCYAGAMAALVGVQVLVLASLPSTVCESSNVLFICHPSQQAHACCCLFA